MSVRFSSQTVRASVLMLGLGIVAAPLSAQTPPPAPPPAPATAPAPATTQSANPELVGELAKEMNATTAQAEGAAGALFGLAKSRLKPEEFTKVAAAVPGMDSLLKAAPAMGGAADSALGALGGGGGALGGLAAACGLRLAAAIGRTTGVRLKPDSTY